jgi:hypothetical protein
MYWKPFVSNGLVWVQVPPAEIPQLPLLDFKWGSGFRAEIGYRGAQSKTTTYKHAWQVQASFLTYKSQAPSITGANNPPVVFNYFSNASFDYKRLDLAAAWPFWLSTNAIFRLLLGVSGVDVKNKNQVTDNNFNIITSNIESDNWNFSWHYKAAGLLTGIEASLPLASGFALFANLTPIFYTGNLKEAATFVHVVNDNDFTFSNSNKAVVPKTFLDLRAGLDYKHWLQKACLVYAFIGYEITWMFNLDQVRRELDVNLEHIFTDTPTDIGTQGVTIRLGFEF